MDRDARVNGLPDGYAIVEAAPDLADYTRLRAAAGLSPHDAAAAAIGLAGSFVAVRVELAGRMVGMGRIVGDGGLFFQIVDIAVEPAHQGRGLGEAIMTALIDLLRAKLAAPAHVSLIADGEAHRLYARYGFLPVAPASIGMSAWIEPAG